MNTYILTILFFFTSFCGFAQSLNIGVITSYQQGGLKKPASRIINYDLSSEIYLGVVVFATLKAKPI